MEAMHDILHLVKEVPIKGPVQNYDPINFDDFGADKYGGFGEGSGNRGNRGGGGGGGGRDRMRGSNEFRDRFERRDDRRNSRDNGGRSNNRSR